MDEITLNFYKYFELHKSSSNCEAHTRTKLSRNAYAQKPQTYKLKLEFVDFSLDNNTALNPKTSGFRTHNCYNMLKEIVVIYVSSQFGSNNICFA